MRVYAVSRALFSLRETTLGGIFSTPVELRAPRTSLWLGTRGEPPSGSGALEGLYDLATELTRAPRADLPPRRASLRSRLRGAQATGGGDGALPTTCPRVAVRTARRSPRTRAWPLVLLQTREALVRGRNRGWNPKRRSLRRVSRLTRASSARGKIQTLQLEFSTRRRAARPSPRDRGCE